MARRLGRIIGWLLVLAGLAGCSALKLGYENMNQVAYWWLDGYLDFNDNQARLVREDLLRLHDWHRRDELPQLITLLHGMEDKVRGDITPAQACAYVPRIRERLHAVSVRALPSAVTLAMSLDATQIQHLQRKYERNNADFRSNWVRPSAGERLDKRLLQFMDRAETFYGRIEDEQRQAVRSAMARSSFDPERTLAEYRRRQGSALATLRRLSAPGIGLDEAQRQLRALTDEHLESPDAAYRNYQRSIWDENCRNLAALHNTTSAAQRESAVRRLQTWQRQLRELAQGR